MANTPPNAKPLSRFQRVSGAAFVCVGLALGVASLWASASKGDTSSSGQTVAALAMVLIGAAIVARTGRPIGWLTAVSGALPLASALGGPFEDLGFGPWLYSIGLLLFLFPDGRPVSRRWNWVLWAASAALLLSFLLESFGPSGRTDQGALLLVVFAFIPVAVASLIVRYTRSAGVERLQLRWLMFAGVVLVAVDLAWELLADVTPLPGAFWDAILTLGLLGLPAAIGIAVLRYRLYEIDRIISRTLSYSLVVGTLGLLYVGVIALTAQVLPTQNSVAVAGATLAVAALFNPLRRRVQRATDKRFNRSGYQAQALSDRFGDLLQVDRTAEQLVDSWATTVSGALQPRAIGVWLAPAPERIGGAR